MKTIRLVRVDDNFSQLSYSVEKHKKRQSFEAFYEIPMGWLGMKLQICRRLECSCCSFSSLPCGRAAQDIPDIFIKIGWPCKE